jgi:hypothetical protein
MIGWGISQGISGGTQKELLSCTITGFDDGLDSSDRYDGERRMAVANALGQRGSKCANAAPWKSPMMACAPLTAIKVGWPNCRVRKTGEIRIGDRALSNGLARQGPSSVIVCAEQNNTGRLF